MVPYSFQLNAVTATVNELSHAQRATVSMCCGSGKTLTGCLIANALNAKVVAVLVPTILLAEQVASVYKIHFCKDVYIYNSEYPFSLEQMTADVNSLEKVAIITTYNSAPELFSALSDTAIDLAIYDEAHRTAGKFSSLFNATLSGYDNIKKRLFMTATPRHASISPNDEDNEFFSMDNESIYGKIAYSYQIREAINDGVITDYKILVACVSNEEVREYLKDKSASYSEHKNYALALTLKKAMDEYGLKKIITYHSTIDDAKKAAAVFSEVIDNTDIIHVSSRQGPFVRNANFRKYQTSHRAIITNARCLNEGMDVPATDAVMFCNEKSSVIDIVQCTGRAIRRSNGKEMGYIILPVLSGDDAIEYSDFSPILQVLNALSENDTYLHQMVHLASKKESADKATLLSRFFLFTDSKNFDISKLASSIYLKTIESVTHTFFERLEALKQFKEKYGHCRVPTHSDSGYASLGFWVKHIRKQYNQGKLDSAKISLLDSIGFIWNVNQEVFFNNYEKLRNYLAEGHSIEDASVGDFKGFIKGRRAMFKKARLPDYQKEKLQEIGFYFEKDKYVYKENIERLKKIIAQGGPGLAESGLSDWLKYLRNKYKKGTLEPYILKDLLDIGITMDLDTQRDRVFNENIKILRGFYAKNQVIDTKMRSFLATARRRYKKGLLEPDRLAAFRELETEFNREIL